MKFVGLLAAALALSSCMSVKARLHPAWDPRSKPAYEDYFDSYLFSFGEADINLARVCMDQKPMGLQKAKYFDDVFLSVITLGIYTPTTIKVWCGP